MEKIEIGYTEEKERRIEAAKDLQELGKILAADMLKRNANGSLCRWIVKDPKKYDTPSQLAEFGMSRPPMSWQYVENQNREGP